MTFFLIRLLELKRWTLFFAKSALKWTNEKQKRKNGNEIIEKRHLTDQVKASLLRHLCRCHPFRANQAPAGRGSKLIGKSSSSIPAQQEKRRQKRGRRSAASQLGSWQVQFLGDRASETSWSVRMRFEHEEKGSCCCWILYVRRITVVIFWSRQPVPKKQAERQVFQLKI